MTFSIIVAVDKKNGIGLNNSLPWRLKKDLTFFRKKTLGACPEKSLNSVIMASNTWKSIPPKYRPLSKRHNIVLTSEIKKSYDNVSFCPSLEKALALAVKKSAQSFIIGGETLYFQCLKVIDKITSLYITEIDSSYNCDRFFPKEEYLKYFKKKQILENHSDEEPKFKIVKYFK